jgi:DNA topoisomerase-1
MKNLVVVESPAKARTIERYLGPDYHVIASLGHVRDLPENPGKGELGVDVAHDFAPEYVVPAERRKQVDAISKAARSADNVYLATDLDREGEAIAWHVAEAAHIPDTKTRRVTFSEITPRSIREAFEHPRAINRDLVDAQQARRVVDRLVGYTLSPLLWRKVRAGLSAGRVQSVAVRLVVEREREITGFTAREYWTLQALLRAPDGEQFLADLVRIDGAKAEIPDEAAAREHEAGIRASEPAVSGVNVTERRRTPAPPFTTSTLQQEASRQLGFSPKRTMSVAQRLYEGVDTPDGHVGLITYMRTDSVALAREAMREAGALVRERYGEAYALPRGRTYRTRTRGAQEAHEAIRPTSFRRDPESLAGTLGRDEARLYRLIWRRALASQMADKKIETTTVDIDAGRYALRATASRTTFDGFSRIYTEGRDDAEEEQEARLPTLAEGDRVDVLDVVGEQHFTEPPPRYTEASLIKALEERGIGRPSTYAATISTILDRGYVRSVKGRLHPEPVGEVVTDLLVQHFSEFVDPEFTARMEQGLDDIAEGRREWVPLLRDFYGPFRDQVDHVRKTTRRRDFTTEPSDEVCSEGHPMVVRLGRYGKFLACSLYPEHKETRPLPGEENEAGAQGEGGGAELPGTGDVCPKCGAEHGGHLVTKRGRFGPFLGCSRYPECDYIQRTTEPPPQLAFEATCPECGKGHLVGRRARRRGTVFYGCSRYPNCRYTTEHEPLGPVHADDDGAVAAAKDGPICLKCGASVEVPEGASPGIRVSGGPPNPAALQRPARGRRRGGRPGGAPRGSRRATTRRRTAQPA